MEPNVLTLDTFPNPMMEYPESSVTIESERDEFTCLCPVTGQPDFGKIRIVYTPNEKCVESKSLKLYLQSYRNQKAFHEAVIARIASDFIEAVDPAELEITGYFSPRGGLSFQPSITWQNDD
jgi:7-cyano-7-deazaguanine reductase